MTLAELLVGLRTGRGLSQEQLAERCGVSVRAIGDLERGATRRPQRETLRALADGLRLDSADRAVLQRLARSAPPASTRPAPGRRPDLPAPVTSLVGRAADVAAVTGYVRDPSVRLVTVTGTGGVGKSRLALEVGRRAAGRLDRVAAVDLSPLDRPDDVPQALADALGCRTAGWGPADAVAALISDARWLLILDSFEHVADAAGGLADLLGRCPRLTALVTSRAPLRLRGEHVWPLAPLEVPAPTVTGAPELAATPAVALLVQRTAAVRPGFTLTAANAADIAALCRRLDGLPLAIELAAAQLRTQEPAQLLAGIADLPGAVDLPDRQQTLRRTVEWSTGRLGPADRLLLGVLAVFAGGASTAAVRTVLRQADADVPNVDASLALLAAGSMLSVVDWFGAARVTMLDTIREVAVDLLAATGFDAAVRRAHAGHFLAPIRDPAGRDRVDVERDNVRAALSWTVAHAPELLDVPLARGLTAYHFARGQFVEAHRTLRSVADAAADGATRAWALHGAAIAANESGEHATALAVAQDCAALFGALGDTLGRCTAMTVIGNAQKALGRYAEAQDSHLAGLTLAREAGDQRRVTVSLNNLGTLAHDRGEYDAAIGHYAASLAIKQEIGDDRGEALIRTNLGGVENDLGRYAEAEQHLRAAVAAFRAIGEPSSTAFALAMLAEAELGLGRADRAAAAATEAVTLAREIDYRPAIGLALARLGEVALARGDRAAAMSLLHEALEHAAGPPEQARTLDRLAAATADISPAEAVRFRTRAANIRAAHGIPVPPADRALHAQLQTLLDRA
jgi:predicted ATPase/DNA-binding XRE family transcriptional regulator